MHHSSKTFGLLLSLLLAVCLFGHIAQAKYAGSGLAASSETSTYVFVPDQSKLVQTGGIAGLHWTYSIKGEFRLTVDPNAGTASFAHVDANATDDSPFKRTLDLNHVFNMTSLVGTVEPSGSIRFTGKASDGSDVLITVTLQDGLAHLIGQTTPPPNSADFFIFSLDAVAQLIKYGGGSGTADDPYQIATAADLMLLGDSPEDYDKHFILTDDIDLDPNLPGRKVFDEAVIAPDMDPNDQWGDFQGTPFIGVFDGKGHRISRLTIKGVGYLGLFGRLGFSARVKDLGVVDGNIRGSAGCIGSLVGSTGTEPGAGGAGHLTRCYSSGVVTGEDDVGGLVGRNWNGAVTQCYSGAAVGSEEGGGGLVGTNMGSVTECYSTAAVVGNDCVGGLIGWNSGAGPNTMGGSVVDCFSTGAVSGNSDVGGLVGGNAGTISGCYSIGAVSGKDAAGGLLGSESIDPWATVTDSFWDIDTSAQTTSAGGIGKTTAEMQMGETFLAAGWDFVKVWGIGENQTYPYLRKYSAADINQDTSVNFLDLAALAENWLTGVAP